MWKKRMGLWRSRMLDFETNERGIRHKHPLVADRKDMEVDAHVHSTS